MWGYPEQFMPVPGSQYHPPGLFAPRPRSERRERPATPAPDPAGA
jgi:hypothetical protein